MTATVPSSSMKTSLGFPEAHRLLILVLRERLSMVAAPVGWLPKAIPYQGDEQIAFRDFGQAQRQRGCVAGSEVLPYKCISSRRAFGRFRARLPGKSEDRGWSLELGGRRFGSSPWRWH